MKAMLFGGPMHLARLAVQRTAFVLALASGLGTPVAQAAPAAALSRQPPPLAGSACPAGGLVDAVFRDAAVGMLRKLGVQAPGKTAHGAVRSHLEPGHVDGQGHGWQQVSAYAANLGFVGALRVAPALLPMAADWLRWQSRHIAPDGALRGVVLDHWVRSDTLQEAMCPPGLAEAKCGTVDAFDSTAASTLLMAEAFQRHGGNAEVLREPGVRRALEAAAETLVALAVGDDFTIATPRYPIVFTMDVSEVIAGWRAWAAVQSLAYAQPTSAGNSLATANRIEAAMRKRLWLPKAQAWRVSLDVAEPSPAQWYPDTVAQAWPMLWGIAGEDTRPVDAWRKAVAPWRGDRDWSRRNVDPDGFWWPAVAVAARCVGDEAGARAWVGRARAQWLDPRKPFAWPFQVSDLLWLTWMADPP